MNILKSKLLLAPFLLALILSAFACSETDGAEREPDFSDPRDVFAAFVERVAAQRFDDAMALFCHREKALHFDLTAMPRSMRSAILPPQTIVRHPASAVFNQAYAKALAADAVSSLVHVLLLGERYKNVRENVMFAENDAKGRVVLEDLIASLNPAPLANLTLAGMDEHTRPVLLPAEQADTLNRINGSDEWKEYAVLYRLGETCFSGIAVMARYGDRWFVEFLYCTLGSGAPAVPTTCEEYKTILRDEQDAIRDAAGN